MFATVQVERVDSLETLLAKSDYVSLHIPMIKGVTENIMNQRMFDLMKVCTPWLLLPFRQQKGRKTKCKTSNLFSLFSSSILSFLGVCMFACVCASLMLASSTSPAAHLSTTMPYSLILALVRSGC